MAAALEAGRPSGRQHRHRSIRRRKTVKITLSLEEIGFSTLPDQVHRKSIKKGFDFTLMVVGESGLGKSTVISSLFLTDLYKDRIVPPAVESVKRTVNIEKKLVELEEKGVKLRLTIVDTPGFGDSVNNEHGWKAVTDYIDEQFNAWHHYESGYGVDRKRIVDGRVHCCLYFVSPFGRGLRPIDIKCMKNLEDRVNIIPVIGKADTLTKLELATLKQRVMEQIDEHKIRIYEVPESESDEEDDIRRLDREIRAALPFALIGGNATVEVNGKRIRGRLYPWGIVEIDNPDHCDFLKLRTMICSTHMQDLKEVTEHVLYESYRCKQLAYSGPVPQAERGRTRHEVKAREETITHTENGHDTDNLLKQKEEEIRQMQQLLVRMQAQLTRKNSLSCTDTSV